MYADRVTESMQVAIDETDRRRAIQDAYNVEHGIEPTTIVKGIRDINERLRAVAESTVVYASEREAASCHRRRPGARSRRSSARMEAEMKAAAKQLEFERAAALRDEIQQIRLRVLEEDASITVGRAAERAAGDGAIATGAGLTGAADRGAGRRGAAAAAAAGPAHGGHERRRSCPPTRSRPTTSTAYRRARRIDENTRRRLAAGHPRRARGRRRAGRRAGSTGRPGTGRSRRTSASAPASARDAAADARGADVRSAAGPRSWAEGPLGRGRDGWLGVAGCSWTAARRRAGSGGCRRGDAAERDRRGERRDDWAEEVTHRRSSLAGHASRVRRVARARTNACSVCSHPVHL